MVYDSQISFTLDTICPWTYLAKKRLDEALRQVRATDASSKVNFTVHYFPYQLYPEASQEGEDKYEWYKKSKYGDSEEKMKMYTTLMSAYGVSAGIDYKFHGTVANTLQAHRVIQTVQSRSQHGPAAADRLINALYRLYFEEEQHPSSEATLMAACKEAGLGEEEARKLVQDEDGDVEADGVSVLDVKMLIREQAGNGVDSVPSVVVEGRRRDVTLVGAKEVEEYVKALEQVVKESV